jgi:hypothetical protein
MSANFWPELRPQTAAQIEACLRRGEKIEAIVIYREATNAGLKEAKDAIERGASLVPAEKPKPATPAKPTRRIPWTAIIITLIVLGCIIGIAYLMKV